MMMTSYTTHPLRGCLENHYGSILWQWMCQVGDELLINIDDPTIRLPGFNRPDASGHHSIEPVLERTVPGHHCGTCRKKWSDRQ